MTNAEDIVRARLLASADNFRVLSEDAGAVASLALRIADLMKAGGLAMFCGNGGSAADAQHLAAELQGRFLRDRRPFASVALTTNTSTMTAIGNDYGFDDIFARQVLGLGRKGDIVVGISTSGNSGNVLRALEAGRKIGAFTVGLTGSAGGAMKALCDTCICVPSDETPRIQEMHIAVGHAICEIVEQILT